MQNDDLFVEIRDPVVDFSLKLYADYLVLAAVIIPYDNSDLIELYKCSVNTDGFLNEAHPKLRPVDLPVDGLFGAGLCTYPKPVDESIAKAHPDLAQKIVTMRQKAKMILEKFSGKAIHPVTAVTGGFAKVMLKSERIEILKDIRAAATPGAGRGVGCVEAPRDTLIHDGKIDEGILNRVEMAVRACDP